MISDILRITNETYRADTQVDALQVLSAKDAEALVDDTTLLARLHGASTERMPSCLNMV